MDDTIFDPWYGDEEEEASASSPRVSRWRSAGNGPKASRRARAGVDRKRWKPTTTGPGSADAETTSLPSRSAGDFLVIVALPLAESFARRLRAARHEASIDAALDVDRPLVGLTLSPQRGPLESVSRTVGRLELSSEPGRSDLVTVRSHVVSEGSEDTRETSVPVAELGETWVEQVLLRFVSRVLSAE